ncbi:hypothetical protein BB561_005363 [Smittium simulii]|uniref:Uncharacterized protein n=1 Tax=Smittium simulii TaxID=133385 RepID=A0A2T9YAR5_9FUNG|nr:hypothetical protein BB561_005363 [Smittium simulii]
MLLMQQFLSSEQNKNCNKTNCGMHNSLQITLADSNKTNCGMHNSLQITLADSNKTNCGMHNAGLVSVDTSVFGLTKTSFARMSATAT